LLQRQVVLIRAGVMLEQAFAFIYRSTFPEADKVGTSCPRKLDLIGRFSTKQSTFCERTTYSAISPFTSSYSEPNQPTFSAKNTLQADTIVLDWPTSSQEAS
jgi:hypothetical protein